MPPRLLIKLVRVDGLSVLQHHMGLSHKGKVSLEDGLCVVHGHGDDGAAGLLRNLQGSVLEGQHGQLRPLVPCALREDADGDAVLHIVDGLQDSLEPLLGGAPVQEEAVEIFHPVPQERVAEHLLFRHIPGQPSAPGVGQQDVKIAPVVSYIKDWLVGHIFLPDNRHLHARDLQHQPEGPLHHPQAGVILRPPVHQTDKMFHDENRYADDEINEKYDHNGNKSYHNPEASPLYLS